MLLAIDIGNSSIKFGVFDGDILTNKFSIPTVREYTPDEVVTQVNGGLAKSIDAAIACSVVPEVERVISKFAKDTLGVEPRFVRSTDELGLKIDFNVETTGTDRLVNSFAAAEKYGTPCVVVSFGTATTIDVVGKDREYLGGLIAPGLEISARALSSSTSQLPEVELSKPNSLIARTTEAAIRSGVVNGHIAMINGLLDRVIDELGDQPHVIATGGFARTVAPEIGSISSVDNDLTLEGLRRLFLAG